MSAEALEVLAMMGIDVEDVKRKLASGEWFIVEGDAECVLGIVEVTRHVALVLAVKDNNALCLARKTEAFKAATGLGDDVLRRVVWMEVVKVSRGCVAHSKLEDRLEEVAEAIASAIVKGAEKALERVEQEGPSYVQ